MMMTWQAFGIGAAWLWLLRPLVAEALLARRMWSRWRRSPYPSQVEDSKTALRGAVVFSFLAAAWTGVAIGTVLFTEMSFK